MFSAMEFFNAIDDDSSSASAFDFRPHFGEEVSEVNDLGFGGGTFDHGGALGENRRHHDIARAKNRRTLFAPEIDHRSDELTGKDFHIPTYDPVDRSETFEAFEMEIDWAVANYATTGKGDSCFFFASE